MFLLYMTDIPRSIANRKELKCTHETFVLLTKLSDHNLRCVLPLPRTHRIAKSVDEYFHDSSLLLISETCITDKISFMVIDFSATVSGLRRSIESEEEAGVFHRDKYERARAVLIFLKFDASKWDRKYRLFYVMSVLDEYSPVGTFRRRGDDDRKQRALLALSPYNVSRGANSPPYPCASPL